MSGFVLTATAGRVNQSMETTTNRRCEMIGTWKQRQDQRMYLRGPLYDWAEIALGGIAMAGILLALMMV